MQPFSSWDPKICFTLRMSLWIELIFCILWYEDILYLWLRHFAAVDRRVWRGILSALLSCRLSGCIIIKFGSSNCLVVLSSKLDHQVSLNFDMVLETLIKFYVTNPEFLEKLFLPQKVSKWAINRPKICFFLI